MGLAGGNRKELTLEQASPVIRSIIEQLKYPYRIFSTRMSSEEVMEQYEAALQKGKQEGFVPVLVPEDDILEEYFGIIRNEDGYSIEKTLKSIGNNGKEILARRFAEYAENDETENFGMEAFLGEIAGGEVMDMPVAMLDFGSGGLKETILFEVPTENPWEVVAYVPFGGWNDCPAVEDMAAVCKYWYEKYGAVPVTITHDTLEFMLPEPVSEKEVMDLAKEHFAFCTDRVDQCTRTGTVGEVADCIRRSRIWYFWWD